MLRLKERIDMFSWRLRNREFWHRGQIKHWWDWFHVPDPYYIGVPRYKLRKYCRWLIRMRQANRIIPTTLREERKILKAELRRERELYRERKKQAKKKRS